MYHKVSMLFADLMLVVIASMFALTLRDNLEPQPILVYAWSGYLWLSMGVAALVLLASGLNRSIWRLSSMIDYTGVVIAVVVIVLVTVMLSFFVNRLDGIARSLPVLQGILMVFLMVGARVVTRLRYVSRLRSAAILPATPATSETCETVLIVGLNTIAELYLHAVTEFAADRIRIAGMLGRSDRHTGRLVQRHEVLGTPEEIASVLRALEVHGVFVDRIVVTTAFSALAKQAQEALLEIEGTSNIRLDLFAERMGLDASGKDGAGCPPPAQGQAAGKGSVLLFEAAALTGVAARRYWRIKRAVDLVGATGLVLVLSPVMLLVALLVALDLGPMVIFWQQRPGLGGRPFRLYKFCTMRAGHDANGRRLSDDERVSAIGRLLRRTRLDELPQLYNVVVGEMSFIGPRPLLPVDQPATCAARLLVRPGLTGWAQVMGGRRISPEDKAALDLWYVQNASLGLDLRIIGHTIAMVLLGERVSWEAVRSAWRDLREAGICL